MTIHQSVSIEHANPVPHTSFMPPIPADNESLFNELTRLAGHINAAEYCFLKLLAELVEREAWDSGTGMKSPAHWLNYQCGIAMGAAREKVRVAKALPSVPRIDAAFSRGELSYSKVRAMTRVATPDNESLLLDIAHHGTASQMELLVRKYTQAKRLRSPDHARAQHADRSVSWFMDDDGMLVINARLPPEQGTGFIKAMEAMMEQLFRRQQSVHETAASGEAVDDPVAGDPHGQDQQPVGQSSDSRATDDQALESQISDDQTPDIQAADGKATDNQATHSQVPDRQVAESGVSAETTFPQKRADAFSMLSEQALYSLEREGVMPVSGGDRFQVMVHVEREDALLSGERVADAFEDSANAGEGGAVFGEDTTGSVEDAARSGAGGAASWEDTAGSEVGTAGSGEGVAGHQASLCCGSVQVALSPQTARRLACDASQVTVLKGEDGTPLNIGRRTRTVPPAIRRALVLRDGGCRFPGCSEQHFVDAHHIHHWCDGGETSLKNLVLLCRHHHRLIHEEGYDLGYSESGTLVFRDASGKALLPALYPQFPDSGGTQADLASLEDHHHELGLRIDEKTARSRWTGEALDYHHAVWVMMGQEERRAAAREHRQGVSAETS